MNLAPITVDPGEAKAKLAEYSRTLAGEGRTVVPIIPPAHRPRRPRLAACHLLWEVESWTPEPVPDEGGVTGLRTPSCGDPDFNHAARRPCPCHHPRNPPRPVPPSS